MGQELHNMKRPYVYKTAGGDRGQKNRHPKSLKFLGKIKVSGVCKKTDYTVIAKPCKNLGKINVLSMEQRPRPGGRKEARGMAQARISGKPW